MNGKSKALLFAGGVFLLFGVLLWMAHLWINYKFQNATLFILLVYLSLPIKGVETSYFIDAGLMVLAVLLAYVLFMLKMRKMAIRFGATVALCFFIAADAGKPRTGEEGRVHARAQTVRRHHL